MSSEQAKQIAAQIIDLIKDSTESVWNGAAYCSFDEIDWPRVDAGIATIIDSEIAAEREANKKLREAVNRVLEQLDSIACGGSEKNVIAGGFVADVLSYALAEKEWM